MSLLKGFSGLLALPLAVLAFPSFRDRIPNGRRVRCPDGVAGCEPGTNIDCQNETVCNGVGHKNCVGGSMPLNVFGAALRKAAVWTEALCKEDSDGDNLTNGEELGDPCCLWQWGDEPSDYTKTYPATHPGFPQSAAEVKAYKRPNCTVTPPKTKSTIFNRYNAGEQQKWVTLNIKDFEIPANKTVYKWFSWNFEDDSADQFHVVFAEAIVDQAKYLHHYVMRGCTSKVAKDQEGMATDKDPPGCGTTMGSWAPGGHIVSIPQWAGRPIGKGHGIVAFAVQVHYDNQNKVAGVRDSSGLRIWYTPNLRSIVTTTLSISTLSTNERIGVPPGVGRWFLTRTCNLSVTNEITGAPAGPLNLIGIVYHAHLLGREMYAEVLHKGSDKWQDLGSEKKWHFDDQAMRDLTLRNITFNDGDIIQTTCVMDSRSQSTPVVMGIETTNEMCWAQMQVWPAGYKMVCKGPMWSGELLPTESAEVIGVRHPPGLAPMVLDGTNLMFGGALMRLDGVMVPPQCNDVMPTCGVLPTLMVNQTSKCDEKMGSLRASLAEYTPLEVCCQTACKSICPEHTWCKRTAGNVQNFSSVGSDQKKMAPWCCAATADSGSCATTTFAATKSSSSATQSTSFVQSSATQSTTFVQSSATETTSRGEGLSSGGFVKQCALLFAAWVVLFSASF